jgi:hypothetical protein
MALRAGTDLAGIGALLFRLLGIYALGYRQHGHGYAGRSHCVGVCFLAAKEPWRVRAPKFACDRKAHGCPTLIEDPTSTARPNG